MKVDPTGLASAAQRIADALAELAAGDPAHPALGADPAAVGAATRLSTAASTLVAVLAEQALGLAATAAQLVNVTTGFVATDEANAALIATLGAAGAGPAVAGWAPPSPPMPPDVRPPLVPPPPAPGEAFATAVHSGDPAAGETFISAWTRVATTAEDAADVVRLTAERLPEHWDSPVATSTVRAHLLQYADALDSSGSRARTLVTQANRHVEQNVQARSDIPSPQRFAAVRRQIEVVSAANVKTGGAYAIQLAQLQAERTALDTQAVEGYGTYHAVTDATTVGEPGGRGAAGAPGVPGVDPAVAAEGREPGLPGKDEAAGALSPDKAKELASMLPQLIPAVLGAVGGALGSIGKAPEGLMQPLTQAMGAATQSMSGMMKPAVDKMSAEKSRLRGIGRHRRQRRRGAGRWGRRWRRSHGAGGRWARFDTSVGDADDRPAAHTADDAHRWAARARCAGERTLGDDADGYADGRAGRMAGGAPGAGGGQEPAARPKTVVVPPTPHTESVTGKVSADRIAVSATAREGAEPEPPSDDPPPQSPKPVVRRITSATPKDDE